jgi:hypothetical protein
MNAAPLLWPIAVCLFAILSAAALLVATTLLEHLIALPASNHDPLGQQRAAVRINRKGR